MQLEQTYRDELELLRSNLNLLSEYSIDSAVDNNRNQIKRNRILIGLYNDCKPSDYKIADFIFNEETILRKSDLKVVVDYEVDVLYLSAFILTKFDKVEDIWKFINAKETDFDSSIGFDTEYLLSFGVDRVFEYLENTEHQNKELVKSAIGENSTDSWFLQEEINDWKKHKHEYFKVFEFPIKDEINFLYQAKEYEYLKSLIPKWSLEKSNWTEEQNLTYITIDRDLQIEDFHLEVLKHYNETFNNSERKKEFQKKIFKLEMNKLSFWEKLKKIWS
ncbi:hypothetical protein [Bernardetia sp. MNP-M8]|uniref:hypothetical protein n=1 Tax=Bernardetia sp. MNP-M8 TaxID=3127470 RepID=UPI0030CCDD3E